MKKKPNIILFITHDQGEFLECYDDPLTPNTLKTPNLNKLAKNGIKFTHHFCTAPQCSPSRGSIITSLYPHQNGLMGLVNRGWTLPASSKTLPMYLKENGYTTHLLGFQHETENVQTLGYDTVSKRVFEFKFSPKIMEDEYHKFFKMHENDQKPFYLCIGTPEVHRPFILWGAPVDYKSVKVPPFLPDHKLIRKDLAEFYGAIQAIDSTIGRIMTWLELTGLKNDTLFIYTTDHGCPFPRAKCTLYDPGIKILLLMSWPNSNLFSVGRVISSLTNHLDLLPTILDLIGAEIPKEIEGKSILPLLKNEKEEIRSEIFAEKTFHEIYHPIRCIRTKKYKYIVNFGMLRTQFQIPKDIFKDWSGKVMRKVYRIPQPPVELYDLEQDPHETSNIIHDSYHDKIASELHQKLIDWMTKTNDPLLKGRINPQPKVVRDSKRKDMNEAIYLPILTLIQVLMKNKFSNVLFNKIAKL